MQGNIWFGCAGFRIVTDETNGRLNRMLRERIQLRQDFRGGEGILLLWGARGDPVGQTHCQFGVNWFLRWLFEGLRKKVLISSKR